MRTHPVLAASNAFIPLALLLGCSNPADDVPEAKVSSGTNGAAAQGARPAPSGVRVYALNPETSSVEFVGSKVTGSHNGGFKQFQGELHVVNGRLADSGNKVVIDTTSIWSDAERLTGHLKSPDFFNVAEHPTAAFATTSVSQQGSNWVITGHLTLRGVTKQISFPAQIQVRDNAVELKAEFSLNRFDFDIKYPGKADDLIRKEVVLKLKVNAPPASRPAATAAARCDTAHLRTT